MDALMREWVGRIIGGRQAIWRGIAGAALLVSFVAVFIVVGTSNRDPDLSHVRVAILSGSEEGNYHAIVAKAAKEAQPPG
jgi:hypothetical protein